MDGLGKEFEQISNYPQLVELLRTCKLFLFFSVLSLLTSIFQQVRALLAIAVIMTLMKLSGANTRKCTPPTRTTRRFCLRVIEFYVCAYLRVQQIYA